MLPPNLIILMIMILCRELQLTLSVVNFTVTKLVAIKGSKQAIFCIHRYLLESRLVGSWNSGSGPHLEQLSVHYFRSSTGRSKNKFTYINFKLTVTTSINHVKNQDPNMLPLKKNKAVVVQQIKPKPESSGRISIGPCLPAAAGCSNY